MKDQEILFETAKLAKEKGFDLIANSNPIQTHQIGKDSTLTGHTLPTQTSLKKWLLDEHGIQVYAYSHTEKQKVGENKRWADYVAVWETTDLNDPRDEEFQTYEAALDVALDYALEKL